MRLELLVVVVCCLHFGAATSKDGDSALVSLLEKRLNAVTGRLELLESRDVKQQAEIESLKAELRVQKQRTATLEKLVRHLKGKKENRQPINKPNNSGNAIVDADVTSPDHRLQTGNRIIQRERKAENEVTVAFYARLSKQIVHAGAHQHIKFDQVITNQANAYFPSLGAFVAPVSGTYVFSVTLTAYAGQNEVYNLSKNDQIIASMYAQAHESPYMVVGETAVLQLVKGDNIEIQCHDADCSVHSGYTSFAGFLLQQDFGATTVIGK